MNTSVNWIAAYNYLFAALNSENKALHVGGSTFCRMVQQVDTGSPSYQQLIALRQQQGKSTSRKDFYWDLIQGLPEEQRFRLYRVFVDHIARRAITLVAVYTLLGYRQTLSIQSSWCAYDAAQMA